MYQVHMLMIPYTLRASLVSYQLLTSIEGSNMAGNFIVIATTLLGVILSLICLIFLLKARLNGIVKTMFFILAANNTVGFVINTIANGMMFLNGERNRTTCSWYVVSGIFVHASNRIYSSMISIQR